jgi:GTP:adenosylcobinamide-phosphate guanylyltransferase
VALAAGARHKALALVDGVPVLQRVVRCLRDACGPVPIFVSTEDPTLLEATRELRTLADAGALQRHPSGLSPAASVADFLSAAGSPGPFLVTTADHALLTPAMVEHFLAAAAASPADLVAAVVDEALFRARFPAVRRTFVPLRGGGVTGANLFWFRTREAAQAARFWTRAESVRKRPWRLVALFGAGALLRFALGRLDLEQALAHVSAAMGVQVAAVRMPFAECAIDVDTPADLATAREVAAGRDQSERSSSATKQPRSGSNARAQNESAKPADADAPPLGTIR